MLPVFNKVKVSSVTVTSKRVRDYLPSTGRVVLSPETKVFSSHTGFVDKILKQRGDVVNTGDTLLVFRSSGFQVQYALAQARLERIRYNYQSEALAFPSESNDTISRALTYITGLREAELDVKQYQLQLAELVITAHKSGRLIEWIPVDRGFYTKGEMMGRIVAPADLGVESYFLQNESSFFHSGLSAEILLPDKQRIAGRFIYAGPGIDEKGRARAYWEIDAVSDLLPGTAVEVHPVLGEREGIIIPMNAVLDIDGETVSFTVEDDTARWNSVETRWYSKDSVEVIHGLVSGDELIISNLLMVHEGTAVSVKNN